MIRLFERVKKIDKKTLIKLSCIKTLTSVLFLSGTALYNHYNEVKYEDYYKGEYIKSISANLSADDFFTQLEKPVQKKSPAKIASRSIDIY